MLFIFLWYNWLYMAVCLLAGCFVTTQAISVEDDVRNNWDLLLPYKFHHGPAHRSIRDTQACQQRQYGNTTYSLYPAHSNMLKMGLVFEAHHRVLSVGLYFYNQHSVTMRYQKVYNPQRTFSVLEPGHRGSCQEASGARATVQATALTGHCVVASNAGFFNTHTGLCLGNVVSDGRIMFDSGGIQNVHFGITKSGHIFTGYLSEIQLFTLDFEQLVGGVIWLVRDGEIYIDESRNIECPDTEETGTIDRFIDVVSARTAVGHDAQGRIVLAQVDGKTDRQGVNLREFAALLKEMGVVNAINLDGGGSATSVINGTLVNYPSDFCPNSTDNCAREVSTILCVHAPNCLPDQHCSHHGDCVMGLCQCHSPWTGDSCHILACPDDCSGHGTCEEDGCHCAAGWDGPDCTAACDNGTYGVHCAQHSHCLNNASCDGASGVCLCQAGFRGPHCETVCGYGTYGAGCQNQCSCPNDCFCHPVSGACSNHTEAADIIAAGRCLAAADIKHRRLKPDQADRIRLWTWLNLALTLIVLISISINIWLGVRVRMLQTHKVLQKPMRRRVNNRVNNRRHSSGVTSIFTKSSAKNCSGELVPLQALLCNGSSSDLSDLEARESAVVSSSIQSIIPSR